MQAGNSLALRAAVTRYDDWLSSRPDVTDALCWTVTRTRSSGPEAMALFSPDHEIEAEVVFDDLAEISFDDTHVGSSPLPHVGWLVTTGTHVGILEVNGFGGSELSSLQVWSRRFASTASMFWNVNSVNRLAVGRRTRPDVFEMLVDEPPLSLGPLLEPYRDVLEGQDAAWATGLAIVESETGLRLDERILDRSWPTVRFDVHPESERETADGQREFERALERASPGDLIRATVATTSALVDATDLRAEAAMRPALAAVAAGVYLQKDTDNAHDLRQLGYRLWSEVEGSRFAAGDPADPAFRRYQAFVSVERFVTAPTTAEPDWDTPWMHVALALDTGWPAMRSKIMAMLT